MPDFENVVVRAPYEADIVLGRTRRRVRVDEAFAIPIPALSGGDTRPAVRVKLMHEGDDILVDFVAFEGRLFRPHMQQGQKWLWTAERCAETPPRMDFGAWWGMGQARTTMLGSPFRPSRVDVPESYVRQARKAGREAIEEARALATRTAQSRMVFVDGILNVETRTPGFGLHFGGRRGRLDPCLPDHDEKPGITLIDPALPFEAIEEVMWERRIGTPSDFKVYDPEMLPRTVERDALGCFAVNQIQKLGDLRIYDRRLATEVLATAKTIEDALRDGAPLAPCYDAIERIAAWQGSLDRADLLGAGSSLNARIVDTARLFLDLKSALPAPSEEPAPPDEDDADEISNAFKP